MPARYLFMDGGMSKPATENGNAHGAERRPRYIGVGTNLFDLPRASAIKDFESMQCKTA